MRSGDLGAGCGHTPHTPDGSRPAILRFTVAVAQENPASEGGRLEPVRHYLEQRLHIPVEVRGTTDYGEAIEAFRAKKIEASTLGPFAYVIGSERAGIEAIATRGNERGETVTYSSTLSVRANSICNPSTMSSGAPTNWSCPSSTRRRRPETWCHVRTFFRGHRRGTRLQTSGLLHQPRGVCPHPALG